MRMGEECEIADTNYNLNKLNQSMITRFMSIFRDPNVAKHLFLLYDKYVIVSADKVPNNILFVCKSHQIDCLKKELGIDNSVGNPTYTPTTRKKEEILDTHRSVYVPFEYQPKMKSWIYDQSTGFLNYTSVLSNSAMLLGLPHAPVGKVEVITSKVIWSPP